MTFRELPEFPNERRSPIRILVSAYDCLPRMGSESGAGWSLVLAAAESGETWVMTRANNVELIIEGLQNVASRHPVHVIAVDYPPWVLKIKRRLGSAGSRLYYIAWQQKLRKVASTLHSKVNFDVAHHATFSAFWLTVGLDKLDCPLVIGPLSGGERTPKQLLRDLGVRGIAFELSRSLLTWVVGQGLAARWRKQPIVFISQSREMARFTRRFVGKASSHFTFSHALEPHISHLRPEARRPEILFVGRLIAWKGLTVALDAFKLAGLDATFTVIGQGDDLRRLQRRAKRRGLERSVHFVGQLSRNEVVSRMATASALLFPSFHDSAGFVVSEALTLGLPVICLDHAGPGQLVRQWPVHLSVAVPLGSRREIVRRLAAAIREFTQNPAPLSPGPIRSSQSLATLVDNVYLAAIELRAAGASK